MRKFKEGMRESKLFDTRIYPVVRLATKAHQHPRCWSTHKEYCFLATKSLPWTQSRSPWPRVPLRRFTKKDGGLHVPCTKMSSPLHTKPEGRWRCRRVTKTPRMAGSPSTCGGSLLESRHKVHNLTHSSAKLVLNLRMWSICSLDGLEMFFNVSWVSLNSSNSKLN